MDLAHRPILRGTRVVCADCGEFLRDVRTGAALRALEHEVDPIRLAAVERIYPHDPELAKRLVEEDPREVIATFKFADKFNDFLMNPKARPDLQTPEAQQFLQALKGYHNTKTDAMMPWLTREWKKGRVKLHPHGPGAQGNALQFDGGPDYEYTDPYGNPTQLHSLNPDTLNHWADWYRSDHPSRQGQDIMKMKIPELHQRIKDWDTDMRDKAGGEAVTRGDIEHHYPDGWTVQKLTTPEQLEEEGEKMGHCVGGYAGNVSRGQSLIYSLRDHQNEPHATWEVAPKWYEGMNEDPNGKGAWDGIPDGQLYPQPENRPEFWTRPVPKEGEMVQIQGKGNEPPIAAYQKRIKDYFEAKMPDPQDRPKWEDQHTDDIDDYERDDGAGGFSFYHPGDYGLAKPKHIFDWPSVVQNANPEYSPNQYDYPNDIASAAAEHGQLPELEAAYKRHYDQARADHTDRWNDIAFDWRDNEEEGYRQDYPEPNHDEYEDQNQADKDWENWDDKRLEYLDKAENQAHEQDWNDSPMGAYHAELESAIAQEKYLAQDRIANPSKYQQTTSAWREARKRQPHTHWSTGAPCYCTFTKHLEGQKWAAIPTCEVCGDPLEGGKCKRCDWGGWSNAMGDGDVIMDPTRDVKPGIQSSSNP